MAKIITDKELFICISEIIHNDAVSSQETYRQFLEELAGAVTTAMGGAVGSVSYSDDHVDDKGTPLGWTIAFERTSWYDDEELPLQSLLDALGLDPEGEL